MNSKIGIVIRREYLNRIRKKSFIVMTLLMPLIFAALIFVPLWMSTIKDDSVKTVSVIDNTGKYASLFESADGYHFVAAGDTATDYRPREGGGIYATLIIRSDLLADPSALALYSDKQVTGDLTRIIKNTLDRYLQDEKLASYNIPNLKEILNESKVEVKLQTIKIERDGTETEVSSALAEATGILFTVIIYMFIFVYGGMVMQGVMEEKNNRIIEVMISSVKPFDLMMGKIIGLGLVGLTQFFLWAALALGISAVGGLIWSLGNAGEVVQGMNNMQQMDMQAMPKALSLLAGVPIMEMVFYFVVFFIGGYMLYASIFSAIGASVDSQEDTQQFMLPVTAFVLFAFYAAIYSIQNPHGPLAFWTSIIPLTSPIVMMVRLPFDVPLWQKLLSVTLLYATFVFTVKFSAKIYRIGILMYGKKPSLKELARWIKYK